MIQDAWGHLLTPGQALMIDGPFANPKRKTQYTAVLAQTPAGTWVSLVTQLPNKLFSPLLEQWRLPWCWEQEQGAGFFPDVQREVTYGHSRIDARLQFPGEDAPDLWVELKSVTWAEGSEGRFPDAPTKRGQKHLRTLQALREAGDRAAVLFVVGRDDVETFMPAAEIDPGFAETLAQVHDAGVEVYALGVRLTPEGVWFARDVRVLLG